MCLPPGHAPQPRQCSYSLAELRDRLLQLLEEEEEVGQAARML